MTTLEKNLAKLSGAARKPAKKDWRLMAGRLRDTEFAREADRLGREFRDEQNRK